MDVIVSDAAWSDMRRIGLAIAKDSRNRAAGFVEELYDRCRELSDIAYAFPLLAGRSESGVRRRVYGRSDLLPRRERDGADPAHPSWRDGL